MEAKDDKKAELKVLKNQETSLGNRPRQRSTSIGNGITRNVMEAKVGSDNADSLTIIIVAWNCKAELANCLRSLAGVGNLPMDFETIVVDNGSSDGTVEFLHESELGFRAIGLKVIYNIGNIGLSRATEEAYRKANGDWILLCNPDIAFDHSLLDLLNYRGKFRNALIGTDFVNADGTVQRAVHRRFPTLTRVYFDFGCVGSYLDKKIMHHLVRKRFTYEDETLPRFSLVDSLGGSFLLLNRELLEKLGVIFDLQFPVWWNDIDLAKRAEKVGIPRILVSTVKVRHDLSYGGSRQMDDSRQRYLFCQSLVRYAEKWGANPKLTRFMFSADAIVGIPIVAIAHQKGHGLRNALAIAFRLAVSQFRAVASS